jgi:hypothetical protein
MGTRASEFCNAKGGDAMCVAGLLLVAGYRVTVAACLLCRYLGLGNERKNHSDLRAPLLTP